MKKFLILGGVILAFAVNATALLITGFDNSDSFGYGTWTSNTKDKALVIVGVKDPKTKVGKSGASYKIIYNVSSRNPGYVGFYVNLSTLNLNKFSKLSFWIKGDKKLGYPKKIAVVFKSGSKMIPVTADWKKIEIDLKEFGKGGEQELDFIIDNGWADVKTGAIYIDKIELF